MSSKKTPVVAIVGRANVGKSSFFNAVIGRREAIVADESGTTRDAITAKASWRGYDFWLVDTAGMKIAADDFELTIQEQITEAAAAADIILVMIEAHVPITDEDRRVATVALKSRKPVFLLVNKADKARKAEAEDFQRLGIKPIFLISATHKQGTDDVLEELTTISPKASINEAPDRLRVALLGRPNVGKSSLFNVLAKKQQAIVADRAGTTRDINRIMVRYKQREIELMDTAGIRRGGKVERGVEHFSVLRALSAIEQADVCLLLIDANDTSVHLDQKIAGMVRESGKGLILVVSKWDSVDKDAYTRDAMAPRIAQDFVFVPWAPLIFTSAVSGQNVSKIFDLVLDIAERRSRKYKTAELNRWLGETIAKHPPAGLKNRSPKLNYIVHEDDNPIPSFKVFGAHTKYLHWSYKRFLEREFRLKWDMAGSPIHFWFIEKHIDRLKNKK